MKQDTGSITPMKSKPTITQIQSRRSLARHLLSSRSVITSLATAVFIAIYFLISIFFAPVLASIPPWAVGGALIIVGALMAKSLADLNWNKVSHAVSGFLTVMVMPLYGSGY
jgi:xanthine/uracil/vitamin C permease (AzgA family)